MINFFSFKKCHCTITEKFPDWFCKLNLFIVCHIHCHHIILNVISIRLYCFEPCKIMLHYILYEVGFFWVFWLSFCSCSCIFSSLFIISGFEILSEIKSFIYAGWFSEKCKDFKALLCFFLSCLIVLNV